VEEAFISLLSFRWLGLPHNKDEAEDMYYIFSISKKHTILIVIKLSQLVNFTQ